MNPGILYGVAAFVVWGLFPIYFKRLVHVPAVEILAHRIVWAFLMLLVAAAAARGRTLSWKVPGRVYLLYSAAAVLIGINWFGYVWAVSNGFIVETSLGYFITPLVNVTLGVLVVREKLRRGQWIAVALAAFGVAYLTVVHGSLPWIALMLGGSFGSYGLVKKQAPLAPIHGLTLETGILFVPSLAYLLILQANGQAAFLRTGLEADLLLVMSGFITILPLFLFALAVQRVQLSVVGLLQYIAPTIQLLLGVLVYGEPFTTVQLVGFTFVWAALVVFTAEGFLAHRRPGRLVVLDQRTL